MGEIFLMSSIKARLLSKKRALEPRPTSPALSSSASAFRFGETRRELCDVSDEDATNFIAVRAVYRNASTAFLQYLSRARRDSQRIVAAGLRDRRAVRR